MGLVLAGTGGFFFTERPVRRPLLSVRPQRLVVFDVTEFSSVVPWRHLKRCCETQHISVCATIHTFFETDWRLKTKHHSTAVGSS